MQNSREAWLLETYTRIYQENSLWILKRATGWSWQDMSNNLSLIHSSATHTHNCGDTKGSRRLSWFRVSQTFPFHADSMITKLRLLFLKNADLYVFINTPCLCEMLGRLTLFISTSLPDLTAHHFVHFLLYASIMNPCSCLFYFHLPLNSWAIFSGFKLGPDVLTSPNIHYFEREYPQYCDPIFFVIICTLF